MFRPFVYASNRHLEELSPSVDTYVCPEGELDTAHSNFKVAHKGGELCPVCGYPIERVLVQNRGTYFCPRCQLLGCGPLI